MTCQECELRLGAGEDASEHLAFCADCRAIAEEMRANAVAFECLSSETFPAVRYGVMSQVRARDRSSKILRWGWALSAPATIIVMIVIWRAAERKPSTVIRVAKATVDEPAVKIPAAPVAVVPRAIPKPAQKKKAEPLMVKMLTTDPDVVIYWQIDSTELTESKEGMR